MRRRLLAILAADAVGYSRLMSVDDTAALASLDAARGVFREQIEFRGGRVVDMAGDSVLAVFETVASAVNAALAIQPQLSALNDTSFRAQRMHFRIGVHLGDVIEKGDGTVYGDGVNVASRLQMLGEPGGIVVSEAVRGAVVNRVDARFDFLGERPMKNIAQQIVQFAEQQRLPAVYGRLDYAPNGLLAFGIDRAAAASRAADVVHRIFQGAKPADVPVEQSGLLRMVVNMKAARAIGIQIPDSIRLRADTLIQ
jgi:class 3 adenylate cyclase